MSLHYLVKLNMCQSVHNHSNANSKRHEKLTVIDKHIATKLLKVFVFGSDTRIKMISPLISCLISDALLDSGPCFDRVFRHLSWMSLRLMRPLTSAKYQFPW